MLTNEFCVTLDVTDQVEPLIKLTDQTLRERI